MTKHSFRLPVEFEESGASEAGVVVECLINTGSVFEPRKTFQKRQATLTVPTASNSAGSLGLPVLSLKSIASSIAVVLEVHC